MPRRILVRSTFVVCGLLVAGFCGWTAVSVRQQQRQHRLNRALVRAILDYDTDTALAALRDGADPNPREQPDPILPLWQQWRNLLLRRKPPLNKSDPSLVLIMDSTVKRPRQSLDDNGIPRENARLVTALLDKGAQVNATSDIHDTALMQAVGWDYSETVHILLAHGADVNIADVGGMTPLMEAASRGNEDYTRLLLERGANPNAQNCIGYTALMESQCLDLPPQVLQSMPGEQLQKYHLLPTALQLLLQHHPDFTLKNSSGQTALALARKHHETQKARLLMLAGAKE